MTTVLVPLYNGVEFLEECLRSVQNQVFTDWTCIVGVNGHGLGGGPVMTQAISIVESLTDNRFKVINLPHVKGAQEAINALVAMSTTPWVAHLDADDKWHPMKLHCQMAATKDVDADIIGTFTLYFGDWNDSGPYTVGGFVPEELFHKMNPMAHSSILIKRELAHYTTEFVTYDYDCWLRNLLAGKKFYNVPLQLLYHRIHGGSHFNTSGGGQKPELVRQKYFGHL
jgi:glycosyltransferase involved in cell wall biosynthesis